MNPYSSMQFAWRTDWWIWHLLTFKERGRPTIGSWMNWCNACGTSASIFYFLCIHESWGFWMNMLLCCVDVMLDDEGGIIIFGEAGVNIFGKWTDLKMFFTYLFIIFELEGGRFQWWGRTDSDEDVRWVTSNQFTVFLLCPLPKILFVLPCIACWILFSTLFFCVHCDGSALFGELVHGLFSLEGNVMMMRTTFLTFSCDEEDHAEKAITVFWVKVSVWVKYIDVWLTVSE